MMKTKNFKSIKVVVDIGRIEPSLEMLMPMGHSGILVPM
jgi:hypothetical protein